MIRGRRCVAGGLAGFVFLAGCAATPPAPAPEAVAPAPAVQLVREPPPVTPLPVPPVVIVQAPPPSSAPQPIPAPAVSEEEQQALALLVDLQRYALESGDDLKRELASVNAAMTRARTDANRIRLAMLLTLPTAGSPDDPRALALLEPLVVKSGNSSPLKQIAAVLYAQIVERSRSLREEQRRTAAAQEKLDALRAVERSLLLERSRNAGGGGAGGGGGTGR
ncbi:MAG TPA: hypothetical protein VG429_00155 [Casimicrobiaceae bacterium]|nr:hypothetical protein [Casimicrobiaceae bacterium]